MKKIIASVYFLIGVDVLGFPKLFVHEKSYEYVKSKLMKSNTSVDNSGFVFSVNQFEV